jgi:hypothetical protein
MKTTHYHPLRDLALEGLSTYHLPFFPDRFRGLKSYG